MLGGLRGGPWGALKAADGSAGPSQPLEAVQREAQAPGLPGGPALVSTLPLLDALIFTSELENKMKWGSTLVTFQRGTETQGKIAETAIKIP